MESAFALHTKGRLDEAETAYRLILEAEPDHPHALEGLGVLLFSQGRVAPALVYFKRRVEVPPVSARAHANLGEAYRVLGRRAEARQELAHAVELEPRLAQSWNSLALLAQDEGRYHDAEAASRAAIAQDPRFAAAYINLANALRSLERRAEAVGTLRTALKLEPGNGLAMSNLAQILADVGDRAYLDEAEHLARRAIATMPRLPQARISLGSVLRVKNRHEDAAACFRQAVEMASRLIPPAADAATDAANADSSPKGNETLADAFHGLGLAQVEIGRLDLAETALKQALEIDPNRAMTWTVLARMHAENGDFELSNQAARRALEVRPESPEALWRLALNLKDQLPESDLETMRAMTRSNSLPIGHLAFLEFGIGIVHDARGEYDLAAERLERANRLQAKSKIEIGLGYDAPQHTEFIERMIAAFPAGFLAGREGYGSPDPRPVFVVGLPRSGTTLTEQIIASHPSAFGAGELDLAHRVFYQLPELVGDLSIDPFTALARLTPEIARQSGANYLSRLDAVAPGASRVVDKMPDNFRLLGLIALLWPQARVIVCHRDLRDIAVSCWQTGFERNPWTNDWSHIAQRFQDYRRMMSHWKQTRPLEWLDLSYESLVNDLENQARRLVDFVGLDWNPSCLDFHQTRRVVRTASLVQVRQPIHTRSVERFRRYEKAIEPLMTLLAAKGLNPEPEI